MGSYILAHDLGTSGNKAVLFSLDGTFGAGELYEYPTNYPHPNWVEQDPEDWWKAVCVSTRRLLEKAAVHPSEIAALSFSGQMMGCLPVDKEGKALRPMIIWADTRAGKQAAEMEAALGMENVYRITGHRIGASYQGAKILWVRENEEDVYRKTAKVLLAKDYIIWRLTGNYVTDHTDACGTNLFNINTLRWDDDIIKALDIKRDFFPEPGPSTSQAGTIHREAALATGLLEGTPVISGSGDGSAATVGAGAVEVGDAYASMGSSAWVAICRDKAFFDPQMRTFNWLHPVPGLVTPNGTMQAAGFSYNWYGSALSAAEKEQAVNAGSGPYTVIDAEAEKSPPGSGGLVYLPYLLGERCPWWNLDARGALIGLSMTTGKGDISRAIMEGVGFNLKINLDVLEQCGEIRSMTVIGGGAKGRVWLQILADLWQKELFLPAYIADAASLGAAVSGGVGIGAFKDFTVVRKFNPPQKVIKPNRELAGRYEKLYEIFLKCYENLKGTYRDLAAYRRDFTG
ncbi:xylulokinase [Spirochaetia bacterium]|nr:xylulokinase [Spirochaetia bacterium]